jgi:hypothetical protein
MKPAGSVAISRGDPNQRVGFWQTAENGGDEAESRCGCAFGFGHNFMQSAAGEPTLRQVSVDGGNAKRVRPANPLDARQPAAQFLDNDSAVASDRKR